MAFLVPLAISTGLNLLIARSQTVRSEGPRLSLDSTLQSRYGAILPRTHGSVRVNGNVIVASDVKEVKTTKTSRPSKKGPKVEETTYSYYQTAAVAVALGEQDKLLRIWANNKVIFDQTTRNTSEALTTSKFGFPQTPSVTRAGEAIRFYSGTEDQLPDPKIEDIVDALTGVSGSCPAFRGTCYVVLDEFEVTDFGGRLPNFEFEITRGAVELSASANFDHAGEGESLTHFLTSQMMTTGASSVYHKVSDEIYQIKQQDQSVKFYGAVGAMNFGGGTQYTAAQFQEYATDGSYMLGQLPDGSLSMLQIKTGKEVARYSFAGSTLASARPFTVEVAGQGTQRYWIATDDNAVYYCIKRDPSAWTSDPVTDTFNPNYKSAKVTVGPMIDNRRHIFSICEDDDTSTLRIKGDAVDLSGTFVDTYQWREREDAFPVPQELVWCESDQCLLHFFTDSGSTFIERITPPALTDLTNHETLDSPVITAGTQACITAYFSGVNPFQSITNNPGAQGWMWQVSSSVGIPYGAVDSNVNAGEFKWIDGLVLYSIRLYDGQYSMTDLSAIDADLERTSGAYQFYDSRIGAVVTTTDYGYTTVFGNRLDRQGEDLAEIVSTICLDCGLSAGQIDVTDLEGITVQGVNFNDASKARDMLLLLAEAYNFVGREIDDQIVFSLKASESVRTISYEDFLPAEESETKGIQHYLPSRAGDSSLPSRLELTYFDLDRDYQEGHQSDKRNRNIFATHSSQKTTNVSWPLVLYTDEAAQQAEKMLYTSWVERDRTKWKLGPKHMDLVPGDVVTFQLADGTEHTERLEAFDLGVHFSSEVESVRLYSGAFESSKEGVPGSGVPSQTIAGVYESTLFLMDIPILSRVDEPAGATYIPMYVAVGADDPRWAFAQVQRSEDGGETYTNWTFQNIDIPHGLLASDLPAPPDGVFAVDTTSELVVNFTTTPDDFTSITDAEFLEGSTNFLKVGEEIIQFRDATETGDDQWTFSHLRRGCKGSDANAGEHPRGETAIAIISDAIEILPIDYADLGTERYYMALSKGQYPVDVTPQTQVFQGNAIRPWAPSPLTAENDAGDILFNWVRRSRTAATDWLQSSTGDELANGESVEQYELNIYDDGTLVRTEVITDATTWTYSAADQATDGYVNDGSFTATIAQYSSRLEEYGYTTTLNVVV